MITELTGVIAEHIAAVNAFDIEASSPHSPRRLRQRQPPRIVGADAIRDGSPRRWSGTRHHRRLEVLDHHGDTIVRARYDGTTTRRTCPTSS